MKAGLQLSLKISQRAKCARYLSSGFGKRPDYYKVLGVSSTSTTSDIKTAYLRLCQMHHPDKGGSAEKFAQIQEAYEVLSKIPSRYKYDASTYSAYGRSDSPGSSADSSKFYYRPGGKFTFQNPYETPSYGPASDEYYGIKGIRRQPHAVIILLSIGICMIGATFHYWAVKAHSNTLREKMYERSVQAAIDYNQAKERGALLGRDGNLKRILDDALVNTMNMKEKRKTD